MDERKDRKQANGTSGSHGPGSAHGIPAWLPDAITLSRIALLPVLLLVAEANQSAVLAGIPTTGLHVATVMLLLVIGASDKLDGYLARRSGRPTTPRGAFLDAAADRLVQWSGAWYFTVRAAPAFTPLPLWFPFLIVARDVILLLAWLTHPRPGHVPVEHEMHGKAATVMVFIAFLGAVSGAPPSTVAVTAAAAGGMVVYSTVGYALRMKRDRKASQP